MPEGFENCVKNGGHVVTEKLSSTTYRHICYIGKKRYEGEVKTKQTASPSSHAGVGKKGTHY